MDKQLTYKTAIKKIVQEYTDYYYKYSELKAHTIFDDSKGHYFLIKMGWQNEERIHACVMHLDWIDGKVWIQQNLTEVNLERELQARGVASEDIILGFYPLEKAA